MTLSNAKIYIARVAGAQGDTNKLALAGDAILATAEKWSKMTWEYLKKDNAVTRTITGTVADAGGGVGTVVTVTSTAGLNVGQAVTVTDDLSAVTATTVASITSLTVFTLAASVSSGTVSVVLAAYIPILVGVRDYYLPHDFSDFYSARLLTSKRTLEIIRDREADRKVADQESTQVMTGLGPSSPGSGSGFTAADQRARMKAYMAPDVAENLLLKYYRNIDGAADPVDVPDDLIYTFLDDCKVWFLSQLNSSDPRIDILGGLSSRNVSAANADDQEIQDEDVRMKSSMEVYGDRLVMRSYPIDPWRT